jgi:hypothetical protein
LAGKIDRAKVKEVFTWTKSSDKLVWGIVIVVIGGFVWSNISSIGALAAAVGVVLIVLHFRGSGNIDRPYAELQRAKQSDLTALMRRSFNQINVPTEELLNFEADDLLDLDLSEPSGDLLKQLDNKSVRLFGPPERAKLTNLRYVRVGTRTTVEYNPIQVSILYLTRDRLITYKALLDVTRGDLNTEETDHIFLRDVVQIGTVATTERYTATSDANLLRSFKEARGGKAPSEVVVRRNAVRISTTDGRNVFMPIGAPEVEDGSTGRLDRSDDGDNKYAVIAHQMSSRIRDVKAS